MGARPAGAPWLVEGCPAPDHVKSEVLVLPVGALGGLSSAWLGEAPAPAQIRSPCSFLGALNADGQCPPDSRPPACPVSAPLRPLLALCPSPSLLPPVSLALLCQLHPELPRGLQGGQLSPGQASLRLCRLERGPTDLEDRLRAWRQGRSTGQLLPQQPSRLGAALRGAAKAQSLAAKCLKKARG